MSDESTAFKTFEDLDLYKQAGAFGKQVYVARRKLPDSEKFGLVSQIQRAAASMTNNIAESQGRYYDLEQIKLMFQARFQRCNC